VINCRETPSCTLAGNAILGNLIAANEYEDLMSVMSCHNAMPLDYPITTEDIKTAWHAQLSKHVTWRDACQQFRKGTTRIGRPPDEASKFTPKVVYQKWCGYHSKCMETTAIEWRRHRMLIAAFEESAKTLGPPSAFSEDDLLLAFTCFYDGPQDVQSHVYAWVSAPLTAHTIHPFSVTFVLSHVSARLPGRQPDSMAGLQLTISTFAHVRSSYKGLPVANEDITTGPLAQYSNECMASHLCSLFAPRALRHVTIHRLLFFDDFNLSTIRTTGACPKFGKIEVDLSEQNLKNQIKKRNKRTKAGPRTVATTSASSSSRDIDYSSFLEDDDDHADADHADEADAYKPSATINQVLLDRVDAHVDLLEHAWDCPNENQDESMDPQLNDEERNVLISAFSDARQAQQINDDCDYYASNNIGDYLLGDDLDSDDDAAEESSVLVCDEDENDAADVSEPAPAVDACDEPQRYDTVTHITHATLGQVRVEYYKFGLTLCCVSYTDESGHIVPLGALQAWTVGAGPERTQAKCHYPHHKKCSCYLKGGHENDLIRWLCHAPSVTTAEHDRLGKDLRRSHGISVRGL